VADLQGVKTERVPGPALVFAIEGAVYDRDRLRPGKDFRGNSRKRFPQCLNELPPEDQAEFMQMFTQWYLQKQAETE
jgi:hypothetical protein